MPGPIPRQHTARPYSLLMCAPNKIHPQLQPAPDFLYGSTLSSVTLSLDQNQKIPAFSVAPSRAAFRPEPSSGTVSQGGSNQPTHHDSFWYIADTRSWSLCRPKTLLSHSRGDPGPHDRHKPSLARPRTGADPARGHSGPYNLESHDPASALVPSLFLPFRPVMQCQ